MERLHFQIIVGIIREGRKARPVEDWAFELAAKRNDMSVELLDLKEWNLPLFDFAKPPIRGDYDNPRQRQWAEKIGVGDGYLFVSPEYNHGYSPALKNALDYLYAEWNNKPASFITYGGVAGARGGRAWRGATAIGYDRTSDGALAQCGAYRKCGHKIQGGPVYWRWR